MDMPSIKSLTSDDFSDPALAAWIAPLDVSEPCGVDLEYDNDYLALVSAAAGKAETQFAPAESPDWPAVRRSVEQLNERSRDLRLARHWLRARLHLEGFAALAPCLRLLGYLLGTWWNELHPRLDDGDAFARANVLAEFASVGALLGDVRQSQVLGDQGAGQITVRDIEVALGLLVPRSDDSPPSRTQIEHMLCTAAGLSPALAQQGTEASVALSALESIIADRLRVDQRPDFAPLRQMIEAVMAVSPAAAAIDELGDSPSAGEKADDLPMRCDTASGCRAVGSSRLSGVIESREEAVDAIGRVCDYLERSEPTNPASHLLRRAQRLIDRNFLQLVREFAPEAVNEVARVLGLDADAIDGRATT